MTQQVQKEQAHSLEHHQQQAAIRQQQRQQLLSLGHLQPQQVCK